MKNKENIEVGLEVGIEKKEDVQVFLYYLKIVVIIIKNTKKVERTIEIIIY
jgi:hypothetical protein